MIRRLIILLLIVGCAVIPKNNVNTNEMIIGVWEAGYASRPELPKHIWTINQDTIVAESFEPYSHQFDDKSVIIESNYIIKDNTIFLADELKIDGNVKFKKLSFGDEFFVRYVPQSRYFQSQELEIAGEMLDAQSINEINKTNYYKREKNILI